MQRTLSRKYISSERPNLFEPNDYISMVVTFSGRISQEEVALAVKKAYENNEVTRSKIVLTPDGTAYYETLEESGCKIFFEKRNFQEILKENVKKPFDLKDGELIRTFIIQDEKQITVFFMAHHLAGDGMSMLYFIEDIVHALDGKKLTYKPMILMNRAFLEQKAKLPVLVKLLLQKTNQKWKKKRKNFTWEDYERIHRTYWKNHSSELVIKSYPLDSIKSVCPEGVSLNSYLTAMLAKEFSESRVIGIPVSIREQNCSMSNQTSGIAVTYQYNQKLSLEKNAVKIQKRIRRRIKSNTLKYFVLLLMERLHPSLTDAVLLYTHGCFQDKLARRMSEILGYTGMKGRDLGITNLMQIQIPKEYPNFKIEDMLFIPPKVSYTKQVVGIATYGETLHMVHHSMELGEKDNGIEK